MDRTKYESVNHPSHYTAGGIEAIDVIEAWDLNFNLGSVVKYISRAGKKPSGSLDKDHKQLEDLKKALWYMNREVERFTKLIDKSK